MSERIIDAIKPQSCFGRHMNDPMIERKLYNAEVDIDDDDSPYMIRNNRHGIAYMIATKNIKVGDELFLDYSYGYWMETERTDMLPIDKKKYLINKYKRYKVWFAQYYNIYTYAKKIRKIPVQPKT
jgi:hypothetical protein